MAANETHELKLNTPVVFGDDTIETLTFKKPKAKHFRSLPMNPNIGDFLNVVAKLCDQPPSVIDELSPDDMTAACEVVANFMPGGLKIGEK